MCQKLLRRIALIGLLLSAGLWAASYLNIRIFVNNPALATLRVSHGELGWTKLPPRRGFPRQPLQYKVKFEGFHTRWVPVFGVWGPRHVAFPLWMPTLAFGLAWVQLRRIQRRPVAGICVKCGYDLRASRANCPECGTEIRAPLPRPTLNARIRTIARPMPLVGLTLCMLTWSASYFRIAYRTGDCTVMLNWGCLVVHAYETLLPSLQVGWSVTGFQGLDSAWHPDIVIGARSTSFYLPLWMPSLLFIVLVEIRHRWLRRLARLSIIPRIRTRSAARAPTGG